MTAPAVELVAPPARWWWGFRLLGLRLPEAHRAWLADHLSSDLAVRRVALTQTVPFLVWAVTFAIVALTSTDGSYAGLGGVVGGTLGGLAGAFWRHDRNRERMLRWQRVDALGHPVEPRRTARLGNAAATALMLALAVGSLWAFRAYLLSLR